MALYRAAVGQDGRNAVALGRLGQASMALGAPDRAEQAFRAAMAVDRETPDVQQGLAISLLAQGKIEDSLALLSAVADKQPSPRAFRTYGAALDMSGKQAQAQAAYRRGLELAPADSNLHGNLALSLAADGRMDAALEEWHAAQLAPFPDPRQAINGVLLLAVAGRDGEARQQGVALLGPAQTEALLRQAVRVRAAPDPASRAKALGLLIGSGRAEAARAEG